MLGTHADWEAVASFLDEFHCLGLDLPGHGDTPFTKYFFDAVPRLAPPVHLVGYSMGGRLAMQYALRFPERVASLIVASAHFGLNREEKKRARFSEDLEWAKQFLENPIDDVLKRWYDQPLFNSFQVDFAMRRKQNVEGIAKAFVTYSLAKQPFVQPKDALYLVGEKDLKYRALYEGLNPCIIPRAGHAVHLENPEAVAQAIRKKICSLGNLTANIPT